MSLGCCPCRQKCKIFLLPPSGCVVPFWNVRITNDSEESNMSIVQRNKIQIAINTEVLEAGDELVLFRQKDVKQPKPLELVAAPKAQGQAKKKARTT